MTRPNAFLLAALLTVATPLSAQVGQKGAVLDAPDVATAVAGLRAELEKRRFEIVLVIDHAANARSVGLDLRGTTVIFARPPRLFEFALLALGATSGIDLPMKFLVFEDADGAIRLTLNASGYLADRHQRRSGHGYGGLVDYLTRGLGENLTGLTTISSLRSFDDTVTNLRAAIEGNPNFRVPLVLDYGRRGRSGPTLIVFGNPRVGTPLMQSSQLIGLDLPQKFLVWKDRSGNVNITYNDPFFIAQRNDVQGQDDRLATIAGALANFAKAGAGR